MKKTIIAILALMLLGACNTKINYEDVKQGILEQERGRLPLTIQSLDKVSNITIDSIVILNNINPHHGYLVTTWDYKAYSFSALETKTVYVEIDSLMIDKKSCFWRTNWPGAYYSVLF